MQKSGARQVGAIFLAVTIAMVTTFSVLIVIAATMSQVLDRRDRVMNDLLTVKTAILMAATSHASDTGPGRRPVRLNLTNLRLLFCAPTYHLRRDWYQQGLLTGNPCSLIL